MVFRADWKPNLEPVLIYNIVSKEVVEFYSNRLSSSLTCIFMFWLGIMYSLAQNEFPFYFCAFVWVGIFKDCCQSIFYLC